MLKTFRKALGLQVEKTETLNGLFDLLTPWLEKYEKAEIPNEPTAVTLKQNHVTKEMEPCHKLRYELIREESLEYLEAAEAGDEVEVFDAMIDEFWVWLCRFKSHGGTPMLLCELMTEVAASNYSKAGADGEPIFRADGKVLKGKDFFRPELKTIIDKYKTEGNGEI